jgi:hypothetical protein
MESVMKQLKKYLLTFAALVTSSPALDARPRLFARRCAGGSCGQVQALQPVYQPSQPRPVLQAVANLGQAVVAVPQAVVQRVVSPVMPASVGGCPGGVCPVR